MPSKSPKPRSAIVPSTVAIAIVLAAAAIAIWPETVTGLFSGPYMPHGYCFMWNKQLMSLHVISDTLIWLSYCTIAIVLLGIALQNKREISFGWMFICFGTFIVACGFTHFMGIIVLWKPLYWLEGDIKLITAVASLATACFLPPLTPKIRKLVQDSQLTRSAQQQREQAHAFTRSIIDSSSFAIIVVDESGSITDINPAAERLLLYAREDLVGKCSVTCLYDPEELVIRADELSAERLSFGLPLSARISPGIAVLTAKVAAGSVEEREWTFIRKDGSRVPVQVAVTALPGDQAGKGYIFTAFDITERIRNQEYIRHVATHDALTGLPTRILFRDRLDVPLSRVRRFNEKVAIVMIDIDDFKRINDSLGHQAGDEVLVSIAHRLKQGVRGTDTVARMGGDEFVVILCDLLDVNAAERIAASLLASLSAPIVIGQQEIAILLQIAFRCACNLG